MPDLSGCSKIEPACSSVPTRTFTLWLSVHPSSSINGFVNRIRTSTKSLCRRLSTE